MKIRRTVLRIFSLCEHFSGTTVSLKCSVKKEKPNPLSIVFQYQSILQEDPQLPKELLPEDWGAKEAHELYSKFSKHLQFID